MAFAHIATASIVLVGYVALLLFSLYRVWLHFLAGPTRGLRPFTLTRAFHFLVPWFLIGTARARAQVDVWRRICAWETLGRPRELARHRASSYLLSRASTDNRCALSLQPV